MKIAQIPNSTIAYLIDIGEDTVKTIETAASVQSLRSLGDARAEVALLIDEAAESVEGLLYAWEMEVDTETVQESMASLRGVADTIKTAEQIIRSEQSRFGVNDENIDDTHRDRRYAAALAVASMLEKLKGVK